MTNIPTIADVLPLLVHEGVYTVYYNDLNEDFTRLIAAQGTWEDVQKAGIDDYEVAQIQFVDNVILIFLM